MRHLVITVISSLIFCRLSATQETAPQYHIIDDSEDFIPYDKHSFHPILQAHLEGPEDNLQTSIFESETREDVTQREAGVAVELPKEIIEEHDQNLDTSSIKTPSIAQSTPSESSIAIDEPDQLSTSEIPPSLESPKSREEQTSPPPYQPPPVQPPVSHEETAEEVPPLNLEVSNPEKTLEEQPISSDQTKSVDSEVSNLEKTLEEQLIPSDQTKSMGSEVPNPEKTLEEQPIPSDQTTSAKLDEEPTTTQPTEESPAIVVVPQPTDENQSPPDTPPPASYEPPPHSAVPEIIASSDIPASPTPPAEPTIPMMSEVKLERPTKIKPGRIPMKEGSHQHPPSTLNPTDRVESKSSTYEEDEEDEYQFNMFSDVTPKMAIFSGLTFMSLVGGMVYQLMLKGGDKPLVQSADTTNVTKSTNLLPPSPPAQHSKDREIMMLDKKVKLLERKLQLAPLQATLKKLKDKDIDLRLSESKLFMKQLRQYQYKLDENRTLKSKVVADRYERLLQIRNLQDINKIPGVIRYIDYHKKVEDREMNICEMQAEDEFLREQIDLFRELVSEFEKEYSSINEQINRVKAEGHNLERERSDIAVN